MRNLLEAEGQTHVEYLPVRVEGPDGKTIADDYCIVNPVHTQDAIDLEKSEFRRSALIKTHISRIDKLALDRTNIDDGAKLFRATGYNAHFFIRDDLVAAMKKAELSGWRALPAEGWDGFDF